MITYWQLALACILIITVYFYFKKSQPNDLDIVGVKYEASLFPYFGNSLSMLVKGEHISEFMRRLYNSHPNEKYVAAFELNRPVLILRDLNLIKQITIKDFDHFPNHRSTINKDMDLLLGNSLFFLKDEKWKDMRSTLSPAFTGSKMRNMFVFIEDCAKQVANYFHKKSDQIAGGVIKIEAKDIFTRYTNDVIANSAFGLEINSLEDRNNIFYQNAKTATTFTGFRFFIKFFAFIFCPKLVKMLGIPFVDKNSGDFLLNIIRNTIKYRRVNSVVRKDMIHLLMEAERGSLKHEIDSKDSSEAGLATVQESNIGKREINKKWNDEEIYAQGFIFLAAGFETTATLITFIFYEMVRNLDVQKKLQDEIDEFISIYGNKITYDDLPKLKYLDNCVSETLRFWPLVSALDRVCVKKYNMPPPNNNSTKTYAVQVKDYVWVPVHALHLDPAYFPNPEKFDPDRFLDENRFSIDLNAYMPFGIGPRNCIGSRFALMVVKLIVFHIFAMFDVIRTDKTQIPIQIDKMSFNLVPKNGVHVGLRPRNK